MPGGSLAELFTAAVAQHQAAAYQDAERRYRHIITLFPAFADAHSRLGALLMARGREAEAISHIEQALALRPDIFEAWGNLAQAYLFIGEPRRALGPASRALELKETPQTRTLFAHCLGLAQFTADDGRFRKLALRALTENWGRLRSLTRACISLVKLDPVVSDWSARAATIWPARLPAAELRASALLETLAKDELLIALLKSDLIPDIGLERLLSNVRHMFLSDAAEGTLQAGLLDFCCAVARGCFINEYVFALTEAEAAVAAQLRAALEQALATQAPCPPCWPVAVGAYFPLHSLVHAQALLARAWSPEVEAVIVAQVKEPLREREIAVTIPALTPINDQVSRAVRQQYEENPYPRWVLAAAPQTRAPPARTAQKLDVLIAGCGTGLAAMEFVREVGNVKVLAIDLSLASLSYAKRMAQSLGIENIEFAQADINTMGSLGRTFDFIDASGVLHHLADPWAGWRVLLSLLRPGGDMQVSLYSALARQNIIAGRSLITEHNYRPIPEDIRRCRETIMAAEDVSMLKSLSQTDDFFSMSECRDMLFHVQEHRIGLPEIKSFIEQNDLQFTGFNLEPALLQVFARRFTDPKARLDLDCWHRFEIESPNTFRGMYQLWVRKPGRAAETPHDSRR
jgi:2-polyprenyl-3-methyl-5-hydroxy-6-metoxy-1,4-benzoquinol methylase